MFSRRREGRHPTSGYGIPPPYNPIHGENANLRQDGISPFCAMMQVAEEDTYENYVICRGFDIRILKFVDYAPGDASKPGISVAKPFGRREVGTYTIGEVYPAFLPTQGNPQFTDFRQVTYVPPSPATVPWRVGQNPGYVEDSDNGGHPDDLNEEIAILYDHNNKVINWLLIDTGGGESLRSITGIVTAVGVEEDDPDLEGLNYAEVTVIESSSKALLGTTVRIHDRKGCIFDIDVTDYCVWAHELWAVSMDEEKTCDDMVKYWSADDRCCDADTAIYRDC